jgi:hypothetical protein
VNYIYLEEKSLNIGELVAGINEKIAIRITLIISTMWAVYSFCLLAIMPVFWPASTVAVQFISSAVLQLVLLPLILVGQNLLSKASEKRAQEDHETIMAEFDEIKVMHMELHIAITKQNGDAVEVDVTE